MRSSLQSLIKTLPTLPPAVLHLYSVGVFVVCVSLYKCVCVVQRTQVHIGGLWSLGIWGAFIYGVQQLFLHLRHCVTVQAFHCDLCGVLVLWVHTVQRL